MKRVFIFILLLVTALLAAESWEEIARKARQEYVNKNYERAVELYTKSINVTPPGGKQYWLYLERAEAYVELEEYDLALKDCYRALEYGPLGRGVHYVIGRIHYLKGDYKEAVKKFDKAISLDDKNSQYYRFRGLAYSELGLNNEALLDFNRAYSLDEKNSHALFSRGQVYFKQENYTRALADFEKLNSLYPGSYYFKFYLGKIMTELYRYEEALNYFNLSLELEENFSYSFQGRGLLYYLMGDYESALADYTRLIELSEGDIRGHMVRAIFYKRRGEYGKSLLDLEAAYKLDSNNYYVLYGLIELSCLLGELENIERYRKELTDLDLTNDAQYFNAISSMYFEQGDYDNALLYINKALEDSKFTPLFLSNKLAILLNQDTSHRSEIIKTGKLMIRLRPYDASFYSNRAMSWAVIGRSRKAIKDIERAIELDKGEFLNYFSYYTIVKLTDSNREQKALDLLGSLDDMFYQGEWNKTISSYLIGTIDKERLLDEAGSVLPKICEANYYIAIKLLGEAPAEEIKLYLERCIETGVSSYYEYQMARYFLNNFELIADR